MPVRGLGHANFSAPADVIERLRRFYTDIVGLHEGPRPNFRSGSTGYWLYGGDQAVLHLTIKAGNGITQQPPGVFDHLAFDCDDLAATTARLDGAGIRYQTDHVDELTQVQLFFTDPAGVGVELTFTSTASTS